MPVNIQGHLGLDDVQAQILRGKTIFADYAGKALPTPRGLDFNSKFSEDHLTMQRSPTTSCQRAQHANAPFEILSAPCAVVLLQVQQVHSSMSKRTTTKARRTSRFNSPGP